VRSICPFQTRDEGACITLRSLAISGFALALTSAAGCSNSSPTEGRVESATDASTTEAGDASPAHDASHAPEASAPEASPVADASQAPEASAGTDASPVPDATAPPPGSLAALHVQGKQIVDANGNNVILRGVGVPDIGLLFSLGGGISGVTGRTDEILTSAGLQIRVLRLPVYPRTVVNAGGTPNYSPVPFPVGPAAPSGTTQKALSASDYIAQVLKPAVDYATSKNLYVIVDYHQIDNVTTGTSSADALTFWTAVAPVFAGYSNVIYEAFNEPIDDGPSGITSDGAWTSAFTSAAQSWVTTIRMGAPSNVIIVGSPFWSRYPDGALKAGLTGGNLAFTAHIYPGSWPGPSNDFQTRVTNASMSEPVAVTEWGFQIGASDSNLAVPDDTWGQNLQTYLTNGGQSWTAWVADPAWTPPMFTAPAGGVSSMNFNTLSGLTDFGTFVKTFLSSAAAVE